MKLARTFESAEAFRAQWPRSVDALLRLNEGPLVLPDDRRTAARTAIWATRDQPEVARIGLALSKLWAFDERFFGDVIGGGEVDFRWSVYCSAYLMDDPQIAADLLDVYCPLLGAFAIDAFGESFVRKACSTFQDDVSEIIWRRQGLKSPRHEIEFFDWHRQLNDLPDTVRADILARSGLPLLGHESFPPLDVMQVFCPWIGRTDGPCVSVDEYRRDLAGFYSERRYTDVNSAMSVVDNRQKYG